MPKIVFNFFSGGKGKHHHRCHHKGNPRFNWHLGLPCFKSNQTNPMLEITLTNEQKIKATIAPVTAKGKPAELDGPAKWTVVSGDCTVEPDGEDGKSVTILSGDNPGDSEILVEADANLKPDEVTTISDVIKVHVEGAMAGSLGLVLGTPELK